LGWEIILIDLVEDEVEVCWDGGESGLDKVYKDVDGVSIDSCTFVAAGMEDGVTYVAGERVWLGWRWFGREVLGGDWWGV